MKLVTQISILVILRVFSANEATGQDFSGDWQGINHSPGSATTEYWPVSLTLSQDGNNLEGIMHFSARDMPQYYVIFAVTGHVTGPNSFWLDLTNIIEENKQDDNNIWCLGSGNFRLDQDAGKFTGTIDFTNCPFQGQTELFRLELTTESSYCAGETADLYVTGANVKWYTDPDKSSLLAEGNRYSVSLEESTTFYVTQTHYDTESPTLPVTIEIKDVTFEAFVVTECGAETGSIHLNANRADIEFRLDQGPFTDTRRFPDLPAGSYTVTAMAGECRHSENITLQLREAPVIDQVDIEGVSCAGSDGTISVIASGGTHPLSYAITGSGQQAGNRFTGMSPGTFEVQVLDAEGCTATETAEITQPENLLRIAGLEGVDPDCHGDNGRIIVETSGGNLPVVYSLDNLSFQSGPVFESLTEGRYTVYAHDADHCLVQAEIVLDAGRPMPEIVYSKNNATCDADDGSIRVTSPAATNIIYTLNAADPTSTGAYQQLAPGIYQLSATDDAGCFSEAIVEIESNCVGAVRFPTAISPNGDALNETFMAFFEKESLNISSFSVFNRWGNLIHNKENFELRSGDSLWDGTIAGSAPEPGIYAYRLEVNFTDEQKHTYSGLVEIIR